MPRFRFWQHCSATGPPLFCKTLCYYRILRIYTFNAPHPYHDAVAPGEFLGICFGDLL
jgi:hypothetical protein